MRLITKLSFLLFFISFSTLASTAQYKLGGGKYHKSGNLSISTSFQGPKTYKINVKIKYDIKTGFFSLIPKKYLTGTYDQEFSEQLLFEETYINIENSKSKTTTINDLNITHMGRFTIGRYYNGHKIKFKTVMNEVLTTTIAYYHPSVEGIGWVKFSVIAENLPLISTYKTSGILK